MERHDRLRQARIRAKFSSAADAARRLGIPYGTYSGHENGGRGIKDEELKHYARAFKVSLPWLAYGEGSPDDKPNIVKIMGYIGAGAVIEPEYEQVPPEGLGEVELPFPVPDGLIALEVKGDSMIPRYDDGDVVLAWKDQRYSIDQLLGEEAAVRTSEGHRYLKEIHTGPGRGVFTLISHNARPITARLEWASDIYLTVRAAQLKRIAARARATLRARQRSRERETVGMNELPLEGEG